MKIVKYIVTGIICLIIVLLILFIIDYLRINIRYALDKKDFKKSIPISGNKDGYIPQGLAYSDKYKVVLQTSYNSKGKPSKLYVMDFDKKKVIKELELRDSKNKENKTHVGGIATEGDTVWITSDYQVSEYDLQEIINTDNNYIKSYFEKELSIRGDFATIGDNQLFIGDFYLKPFYDVPGNTPLMYCYDLSETINFDEPKYIAALPKMVQGLTITPDHKYIFTRSFTYLINSDLVIYDNPTDFESEFYELNNKLIPFFRFNENNLINNKKLPPMAEGLFYKDKKLYILFESSSDTYALAFPKIKNILELDINKIDRK
ncbi:MAG: hypothetical protein IKQ35_00435 [Bacilli bacterium]|nr:hypothetical protein [Bacilli bacterium]